MTTNLSFKADSDLEGMARLVSSIPQVALQAAVSAVNSVARSARKEAVSEIRGRYNLPARKVEERFSVDEAFARDGDAALKAEVIAKRRGLSLVDYDAKQLIVAAPRAKGDVLRNIGPGFKHAGISVKVLKSGPRKRLKEAFFLPRRAGQESFVNGFGVFIRTGTGEKDVMHLYGMSPDQAFRCWIEGNSTKVEERLKAEWAAVLKEGLANMKFFRSEGKFGVRSDDLVRRIKGGVP